MQAWKRQGRSTPQGRMHLPPGTSSTAGAAFPFETQRIPAGSCLGLFDVSHGNERMGMERYDSAALEGVWMACRVCPPVTFRRCARFYPECAGRPRGALRMFREEKKLGAWSGSSPVRSCPSCDAGPSLCDPLAASSPSHPPSSLLPSSPRLHLAPHHPLIPRFDARITLPARITLATRTARRPL